MSYVAGSLVALQNVVDDTTPELGGNLDANGNDITELGDVTFKTGAQGGTLRTGTSAADKFTLQAYDVNDGVYRTILQLDAGNSPVMQFFDDYVQFEDATDPTKIVKFDGSAVSTGTTRTLTFPDASGTFALTSDLASYQPLDSDLTTIAAANNGTVVASLTAADIERTEYTWESRAAVALATIDADVDALRTLGYATPGDGGGALYKRAASEPSHDGKVQSADGAWWEYAETEANAKAFGAKGDNATNDSAAIQAAIDYAELQTPSCVCYVPPGRYRLNATLRIGIDGFVLKGAGMEATSFTQASSFSGPYILVKHRTALTLLRYITLTDFSVLSPLTTKVTGDHGIQMIDITGFAIRNIRVNGPFDRGISLEGCIRGGLENVKVIASGTGTTNQTGLYMTEGTMSSLPNCANVRINNSMFISEWVVGGGSSPLQDAIFMNSFDGVMITNCRLAGGGRANLMIRNDFAGSHSLNYNAHVLVTNCFFDYNPANDVVITGSTRASFEDFGFLNNTFQTSADGANGIVVQGNAADVRIVANRFIDIENSAVNILESANRIIVSQNNMRRINLGAGLDGGVFVESTWAGDDLTITDNYINCGGAANSQGISIRNGSAIIITGNRVTGCAIGILTLVAADRVIVKNNILNGNTTALSESATTPKFVSDNITT